MLIPARLRELHPELTRWRRELHQHPQTAFEETFASEFIAQRLTEMGIQISRGWAKTGVVGSIAGRQSANGAVRAIVRKSGKDACLWSRWPYNYAAGGREVSLGNP
jgi:metal-dependent amidase/aminoacylase/carboxypeptidase family protein